MVEGHFGPYHGVQKKSLVDQQSTISGHLSIPVTNNVQRYVHFSFF